ncbi:MAG: hypothetical protein CVT98_05745 [Bacteroidetes bacterium HGW-Bacteroidetes-15]|nr:MAG: hypothetical protein CVT98_05745 [Bacteroidetes bacterium HGW-Bacteroidetes-15]
MKSTISVSICFVVACLFLPFFLFGQAVKPQNIYRVTVISQYGIENGKYTSNSIPIHQQIYDSLGRLHTEIDYNPITRYPNNYRWHYFDGSTKLKSEFYLNEKLSRTEEYDYANNLMNELRVFKVNESDTSLTLRVLYTYNSNNLLAKATGYNSAGKKGYTATYKYDSNGNEVERKVKGKRATPPDSILYLKRTLEYDSLNRISVENITITKEGGPQSTNQIIYKYDGNNNIKEKQINNINGKQIKRKEYVYRPDQRIQRQSTFDAENILIDFRAYRYEIYKTSDRRTRILE